MTDYRAVVRHVRYWRGNIHRWSTSYSFTGSGTTPNTAAATTLLFADDLMCYAGAAIVGGTYECDIYKASGGVPVATYTRFAYNTPGSWPSYGGNATWGTPGTNFETAAETALLVRWAGGLSDKGKPVFFRKWYHAVPVSATGVGLTADIPAPTVTRLQTQALAIQTCLAPGYGLVMGNAGRLAGTAPIAEAFYSNHQMPKGRRRKALVTASGRYTGPSLSTPSTPILVD